MARWIFLAAMLCGTACGRTPVSWLDLAESAGGDGEQLEPSDGAAQTCQAVDFLFVIDDSGSMADNQAKLVANYDTFIGGIYETVERLETIHVGVITTDAYAYNEPHCRPTGGFVIRTGGSNSSQKRCGPYADGNNFMTEADDLDEAFRCAARVGTLGSADEAVLAAPVAALSPPLTDPDHCNEGFLREDALLVLVIVTDEDADIPPELASADLLSRKDGGLDDIVVVVLANPVDGTCGVGSTEPSFGLDQFVRLFRYGFLGPICADDYSEVFAEAVAVVEEACPGA